MKILLGPEYVSDGEDDRDSEEASEEEQEDPRDTFVDRTAVSNGWMLRPLRYYISTLSCGHCRSSWMMGGAIHHPAAKYLYSPAYTYCDHTTYYINM